MPFPLPPPGLPHREQAAEPSPAPGEERVLPAEAGCHILSESCRVEWTWGGGWGELVLRRPPMFSQHGLRPMWVSQCPPGLTVPAGPFRALHAASRPRSPLGLARPWPCPCRLLSPVAQRSGCRFSPTALSSDVGPPLAPLHPQACVGQVLILGLNSVLTPASPVHCAAPCGMASTPGRGRCQGS